MELELGGYDFHWVEDPPDDLKCLICLCVARDPQQHPGDDDNPCGKVFCSDCIGKHQSKHTNCPNCRKELTLFKDRRSERSINALKVKCSNESDTCNWTGEVRSLQTHLQSCDYALVPCTNQCTSGNEIARFPRKDIQHHLANDCPRRQYECPHCQEMGEHQERTTTHLDTCPMFTIPCPNSDCGFKIARCNIPTHLNTCDYELVSCKYAAIGCNERPTRKDLKKHEEDSLHHLQITTEKNLELSLKVTSLETELLQSKEIIASLVNDVQVCKEKIASLETNSRTHEDNIKKVKSNMLVLTNRTPYKVKLSNFEQHKSNNKGFYSLPFYTSYSGYKMCLGVDANGWGDGAGTHVSVYAHLMKGDHDDTLTWPFTGSVTVELLNQLEDRYHHKKTTTFSAQQEASQRVVERERGGGFGPAKFISHTALEYNTFKNTLYLKNDCLVFRVTTKIPGQKPWLECVM